LAGFLGKYYIFSKAMERGLTTLTVIAVINSIIGIYYYLKVVVAMYTQPADDIKPEPTPLYWAVIVTSLLLTILLGIYPGGLLSLL
jgi:NADH-quinone oxidoreductase subunit N